jgi:hypothetical protein
VRGSKVFSPERSSPSQIASKSSATRGSGGGEALAPAPAEATGMHAPCGSVSRDGQPALASSEQATSELAPRAWSRAFESSDEDAATGDRMSSIIARLAWPPHVAATDRPGSPRLRFV